MKDYCFTFLEGRFPRVAQEAEACEKFLVLKDYEMAVLRAGIACEYITERLCSLEDKRNWGNLKHQQRLERLGMAEIIPGEFYKYFSSIRKLRNIVAHGKPLLDPLNDAHNVHAKLFKITVWFYKNYGYHDDFVPPEYNGPIYSEETSEDMVNNIKSDLEELVNERIKNELDNYVNTLEENTPQVDEIDEVKYESTLEDYNFEQYKGSYLLNELSKLRVSSKEAVESDDDFSDFKKYIHVDRSIQNELVDELKRVLDEDSSHLIMLCGSVGDGKSHLLAYLKTNYPEFFEDGKFTVHGDATESFDPNKDAIANLA